MVASHGKSLQEDYFFQTNMQKDKNEFSSKKEFKAF